MSLSLWREAEVVYTYLSIKDEVDTRQIVRQAWAAGKRVVAPRMAGERGMRWFEIDSFEGLETVPFGVEEPSPDRCREVSANGTPGSVALVPGLAFDVAGYRMGYGGGYYDDFLSRFEGISVGLCRRVELVDEIPFLEAHDLAVDLVITG